MNDIEPDEMLPEYDFTGAEQGKYFQHFERRVRVVILDDDVTVREEAVARISPG